MKITKINENKQLTVLLEGRLDAVTYPILEDVLTESLEGIESLVMDMEKLEYLSSAGLRVILAAQKRMSRQGNMVLKHVSESILDIFEVTGFIDVLTIE